LSDTTGWDREMPKFGATAWAASTERVPNSPGGTTTATRRSPRVAAKPRTARADWSGVIPKTNRFPPAMALSLDSETTGT
jgi:hypothetical protein